MLIFVIRSNRGRNKQWNFHCKYIQSMYVYIHICTYSNRDEGIEMRKIERYMNFKPLFRYECYAMHRAPLLTAC